MAGFGMLKLTAKGTEALLNAHGGIALKFSKIAMGSGANPSDYESLTDLVTKNVEVEITKGTSDPEHGTYTVEAYFTNDSITKGFNWTEIGLFCEDSDGNNVLYAYANAGDNSDYIPATTDARYAKYIRVTTAVGNASNISITNSEGALYVDMVTFNEHTANTENPHSVTKEQVGLGNAENKSSAEIRSELTKQNVVNALGYTPPEMSITPYVTTAGSGAAYTAKVDGITALVAGVSFIMIPHVVSASTAPTLNVNGLGAKNIRRRLSSSTASTTVGHSASWLAANKPISVTYDGTYWIADIAQPNSSDIYGTVDIEKGGTGAADAETARNNLGITPGNIGAAKASHNHSAGDITSGTLSSSRLPTVPVSKGGTGAADAESALVNLGLTATATEINHCAGVKNNIQTQFDNATSAIKNCYDLTSSGKAISKNDNLNDYQTPGVYSAILSVATTLSNCPVSKGFKLVVEVGYSGNTRLIQTIYAGGATVPTYTRKLEDGAWNPWASQLTSILPSDVYGSTLPTAGTKGRIFFKKVSS